MKNASATPSMPRRSKALLDRADRLHDASVRPVIMIVNCPEPARLGFDLKSERMAMIESNGAAELFEATEIESTASFHRRLVAIARERGVSWTASSTMRIASS